MKVNENTGRSTIALYSFFALPLTYVAVATAGVLLVPYDRRHVPTYHDWMEDEAVRAATASDRLTLEEEYENQESWRAAADKLTFILCQPVASVSSGSEEIIGGVNDAPDRMVGDINFFLTPFEEEDDEDANANDNKERSTSDVPLYSGEVDVMIARLEHRRQGFGRAAVTAFLYYILRSKRDAILAEAAGAEGTETSTPSPPQLKQLVVKIQATNAASISLFKSLGFEQKGDVNYFGEVELVRWNLTTEVPAGYTEKVYQRSA